MENGHLLQQIAAMRKSFFDEEILNEQFSQLEQLEDGGDPNFVEDVFTLYFRNSTTLLQNLHREIEETVPIDVIKVDKMLHKLKGSSASIGANKVLNEIINTRNLLVEGNQESVEIAFGELEKEYDNLKAKLEPYFQLKKIYHLEIASSPK